MHRRTFIQNTGVTLASSLLADTLLAASSSGVKKRVAMIGTGHRSESMGADLS
jgi:hypothetical protein